MRIFFKSNFIRFAGFSIIGGINTLIHLVIVLLLVELLKLGPVTSNCLAFVVANTFSFYANCRWNYRTEMAFSRYGKFFVISLVGLLITAVISALAYQMNLNYLVGTACVFVTLPLLTFIAHHHWTWNNK